MKFWEESEEILRKFLKIVKNFSESKIFSGMKFYKIFRKFCGKCEEILKKF